jgi:hypothetical protein
VDSILEFFKKDKNANENNRLLNNKEWKTGIKLILLAIYSASCGAGLKNCSQEILSDPPQGCSFINNNLVKLRELSEQFIEGYYRFIDNKDRDGLKKAKTNMEEITKCTSLAWDNIKEVGDQIRECVREN